MLAVTIGPKDLAICSARLDYKLVAEANQLRTSIDIRGNGDWEYPFGSRKIGNEMSVGFGRNADDKIGMNPSRAIRSPHPQVSRTMLSNYNIFDYASRVLP